MKTANRERMMASGLTSVLLLIALPTSAQERDAAGELLEWQQALSQEVLSDGRSAIEAMATDAREQLRFRLKQEANARLQRLGRELEQKEYRYTTIPAGKMPGFTRVPILGPRSAAALVNGSALAGDIR